MKRVNTLLDYRTELVEEKLEQESSKKQKVEEDKEYEELKQCLEIVPDDGDDMLKNFNREDLEVLWSIVKARFKKTEPVNYMDTLSLHNLKTMFEHHVEDNVWKNQQGDGGRGGGKGGGGGGGKSGGGGGSKGDGGGGKCGGGSTRGGGGSSGKSGGGSGSMKASDSDVSSRKYYRYSGSLTILMLSQNVAWAIVNKALNFLSSNIKDLDLSETMLEL
ncbi:uncharacterized mitochondrial protein-like protein [Tanacetum coccineum]